MTNYDKIARRAYELWENEGRPQGKDTAHWLQAEAEIRHQEFRRDLKNRSSGEEMDSRRGRRVFAA